MLGSQEARRRASAASLMREGLPPRIRRRRRLRSDIPTRARHETPNVLRARPPRCPRPGHRRAGLRAGHGRPGGRRGRRARGRDLLVSSETGSGKTLAFGIALAEGLLAEAPARAGQRPAGPRALIITPTRELATQVRNELQWLFAQTKLRLGVFTGGTDVRGDLAQLAPGRRPRRRDAGAPRRSRSTRKSLRLDGVRDGRARRGRRDARHGLPRGSRDAARRARRDGRRAGGSRRTLMFSATLPAADPRARGALPARRRPHRRATRRRRAPSAATRTSRYVAHLVAMGERVPAVVNLLRRHARRARHRVRDDARRRRRAARAARQRAASAPSCCRAIARSPSARAPSTALRNGEADVLVATNVAARGLDLPEVDLVVHADLPLNAEALTHRSGRTGRAGPQGHERAHRDARRAPQGRAAARRGARAVHVDAAPSERDIARAAEAEPGRGAGRRGGARQRRARGRRRPRARGPSGRARPIATPCSSRCCGASSRACPVGRARSPRSTCASAARPPRAGPRPSRGDFSRAAVLFEVNLGQSQKAEPGWLLPLICRRGGITRREVGAIRVGPQSSQFEISAEAADEFALAAGQSDPRAPHVRIQRLDCQAAGAPREGRAANHQPGPRRPRPRACGPAPRTPPKPAPIEHPLAPAPSPPKAPPRIEHKAAPHVERKARAAHRAQAPRRHIERKPPPRGHHKAPPPPHAKTEARHGPPRGKPGGRDASPPVRSDGHGAWRPPGRRPPPGPRKAGNRPPPRHR